MSHIVQIVRRIGPGSGGPGVAWHLDREFRAMGHTVETFTYATAGGPVHAWKRRWQERMAQSARIVWFRTR